MPHDSENIPSLWKSLSEQVPTIEDKRATDDRTHVEYIWADCHPVHWSSLEFLGFEIDRDCGFGENPEIIFDVCFQAEVNYFDGVEN